MFRGDLNFELGKPFIFGPDTCECGFAYERWIDWLNHDCVFKPQKTDESVKSKWLHSPYRWIDDRSYSLRTVGERVFEVAHPILFGCFCGFTFEPRDFYNHDCTYKSRKTDESVKSQWLRNRWIRDRDRDGHEALIVSKLGANA